MRLIIDDPNTVFLVYTDEDGTHYDQPVSDLVSAGTLTSPITGEDMEITGVYVETDANSSS